MGEGKRKVILLKMRGGGGVNFVPVVSLDECHLDAKISS